MLDLEAEELARVLNNYMKIRKLMKVENAPRLTFGDVITYHTLNYNPGQKKACYTQ